VQQREQEQQSADPPQTTSTTEETPSSSLEKQLEEEQRKAEEYLDLLRRTQADFINYKRRVGQEQTEGRTVAQGTILGELLPVLDDLGRALTSVPPELAQHPWVQGITLVARRIATTLEQIGVQQVGKPGEPFNPLWHEAVMTTPRPGVPEGTIVSVTRPGYALRERIIRPAQVVVAGPPTPSD
jgi:molecular chaperone GrpE